MNCPVCECKKSIQVLIKRPDFEYGSVTTLEYRACQNCSLVFSSETPSAELIMGFYETYSTHKPAACERAFFSKWQREKYLRSISEMINPKNRQIANLSILDYGCGSGDFIAELVHVGVTGVVGYDLDEGARQCVRQRGLVAFAKVEDALTAGPFDAIFLNHVIEHLSNSTDEVRRLVRNLKQGGLLFVRTPNTGSFLCWIFGDYWRGWETPRHLNIFNNKSIRLLFGRANQEIALDIVGSTSNAMFSGIFHESFHGLFWRKTWIGKALRHTLFFPALLLSIVAKLIFPSRGEELVYVVRRIGQ